MSEIERFDCTSGGATWCQGCYTMTKHVEGDYVRFDDANARIKELLTAAEEAIRLIEWLHIISKDGIEIFKHEIKCHAEMFESRIAPAIENAKDKGYGL